MAIIRPSKVAIKGDGMEVGVRELRDHLSRYLERVKAGEDLLITEHDRPIARLSPLDGQRTIDRLIAAGVVERAQTRKRSRPRRLVTAEGSVSELVAEQRR